MVDIKQEKWLNNIYNLILDKEIDNDFRNELIEVKKSFEKTKEFNKLIIDFQNIFSLYSLRQKLNTKCIKLFIEFQ